MKARRQGFTLVELLIVMVLGSLVLGAVYQAVITQQRATRQTYAIIETQQNTRIGLELLASDLREISATDSDLLFADARAIRYRAMRKGGIVCATDAGGAWIDVALIGEAFAANDSVVIFNDGPNPNSASVDSWTPARITGVGSGSCPTTPGATTVNRLSVSVSLTGVQRGAPVRSFTHVGYRIVDDGEQGVLYRMQGADSVVVLDGLRTIAQDGMRLMYWDTAAVAIPYGNLSSRLNEVGRIQLKLASSAVGGGTGSNRMFTDSLVTTVFLRGNRKIR